MLYFSEECQYVQVQVMSPCVCFRHAVWAVSGATLQCLYTT